MRADVRLVNNGEAKKVLKAGLKRVIAAEPDVTHYDTIVGKSKSRGAITYRTRENTLIRPSFQVMAIAV
jgi:hypothetical protein